MGSAEVEFKVGMTCEGCSAAVTRILKKVEGVTDVEWGGTLSSVGLPVLPSIFGLLRP